MLMNYIELQTNFWELVLEFWVQCNGVLLSTAIRQLDNISGLIYKELTMAQGK